MQIHRLILAIAVVAILATGACGAYTAGDPEVRSIYVSAWGAGCRSAAEIDQLIADAHACNANTIVAQIRRRGDTFYPSPYEPYASGIQSGFDALAYLVQKCHSTTPRLDVNAWFVCWPVAGTGSVPTNPNHPYNKYPQYLTKTDAGDTAVSDDYWFDPGNPNAEQYTYNVIMDVVNRYDVDGINFDYIRYGYNNAGYNDVSVTRFNHAYGRSGQPDKSDVDWCTWRRQQVTNFVRKCYANAIAVKPSIKVSADVFCSTPAATSDGNWPAAPAYCNYFQDWRAWMQEGILDMSNPMSYFDCTGTYANHFGYWTCFSRSHQYNRQTAMTISITGKDTGCAVQQMQQARDQSCPGVPAGVGMSIYSYSSIDSSMLSAIRSVWTTPAAVPSMPWKTAPTKGHIMGNVTFGGGVWVDGATVTISGPSGVLTMRTDGTGFYAFVDVLPGSYNVSVDSDEYGTLTQSCNVSAGIVSSSNFDFPLSSLTITGVAANEASNSATITWTTNGPASSKVYYGLDRNCSSSTTEDSTQVTSHSVTVSGLTPSRTYYFRVYSKNPAAPAAMSSVSVMITRAQAYEVIVDNSSSSASLPGWSTASSSADKYGADYCLCYSSGGTKTATFTPNLPVAGNWSVYETHPQGSNRCTAVNLTVNYNGGSQAYTINQRTGGGVAGGTFNLVCTKPFAAGTGGNVQLTTPATWDGTVVMADAIRFYLSAETTAPSTPVGIHSVAVQDDSINFAWVASTDNVGVTGYRVSRDGLVMDTSSTNSYWDSNLASNTRYTYAVSAYDAAGNKSGTSSSLTVCTLAARPSMSTVTCDKSAGIWQSSGPFTFTTVGGFGAGKVNFYRYAWDTSPSHTWTGSETPWTSGTISCASAPSADGYYLHIKGYNQDSKPGEPADLGPYYVDGTAPDAPVVTGQGGYSPSQTSVTASWTAADAESGIQSYKYAVGSTPGGADLVGWRSTTDQSATITIPSQSLGASVYVSVKAQNGAKAWSAVGTSSAIRIAQPVDTVAAAKTLANTSVIYIANTTVSAVLSDCFYVQDTDRTSGIRVEGVCPYAVGTVVNVGGVLSVNGQQERTLTSGSVTLPQ